MLFGREILFPHWLNSVLLIYFSIIWSKSICQPSIEGRGHFHIMRMMVACLFRCRQCGTVFNHLGSLRGFFRDRCLLLCGAGHLYYTEWRRLCLRASCIWTVCRLSKNVDWVHNCTAVHNLRRRSEFLQTCDYCILIDSLILFRWLSLFMPLDRKWDKFQSDYLF